MEAFFVHLLEAQIHRNGLFCHQILSIFTAGIIKQVYRTTLRFVSEHREVLLLSYHHLNIDTQSSLKRVAQRCQAF